ncbi:transcriptional regulator, DeoR family [Streptoalloteichus tenebrarius]|uniref:Transcriptional regulator, DeoR family n=1 Tax=Streptoalloteichus tenebrarius (strain ATCC 17920 / DSM 40477 / JCM 4838 / CBS 697.72 / NBRC 16177 / NCIMB 11028 / NRRL B-12390 / A12253. 1 / ISP 5477) TaxID=1933 RepID=A0ABT1HWX4_STRSD|nr:DeoR/GlpR family DNA-binding transcription regulator [Streptoalloteichus tenebrarius]MCP2260005.1 transcriptional regulator, DeoR family [Streptoalloteichus tenebrarius]BFF03882.1 DeoR/GlpR family DNA-binding transcription regulator [Streptoalloteichus tenebrarius]
MSEEAGVAPPGNGESSRVAGQQARQQRIRERVLAEGFVRAEALATDYGVSLMTIHRDLEALQTQGWLRKVRGGASALPSALFHGSVEHRMATMSETKRRLAEAALELVSPGQTVMLDESTTCLHLAQRLPTRAPLTVITYFLPVIKLLAGEPGIGLVSLGGSYFPAYDAFLGLHTADAVRSFRADLLFASTTAIVNGRCYHQSQETVHVKRALMESAGRRVLLVDHTKFAKEGLYALAPLTSFDLVLVDDGLPPAELRAVRDLGVQVRTVRA